MPPTPLAPRLRIRSFSDAAVAGALLVLATASCSGRPPEEKTARPTEPDGTVVHRPVRGTRPVPRKPVLSITMSVSDAIVSDLVPLTKNRYTESELAELFPRMRSGGDLFCAMVWKRKRWERKKAETYVRSAKVRAHRCGICRKSLVAGCWNFFSMNDRKVDRDFELVKYRYGNQGPFDCYAVSFVQPYIMHSVLGCRSLTMVDVDWRILDGHFQLLRLFRKNALSTAAGMIAALETMNIGWVAYGGRMKARVKAGCKVCCRFHNQVNMCRSHLLNFQKRLSGLKSVRLRLSALHRESFTALPGSPVKVVFLSNAMDIMYTKWREFKKLMKNAREALRPGQKMVFIHHVPEYPGFALYELHRRNTGYRFRTVCRDRKMLDGDKRKKFIFWQRFVPTEKKGRYRYVDRKERDQAFAGLDPLEYYTHFEVKLQASRRVPRCKSLLWRENRKRKKTN